MTNKIDEFLFSNFIGKVFMAAAQSRLLLGSVPLIDDLIR
jgi:hypothetical protein